MDRHKFDALQEIFFFFFFMRVFNLIWRRELEAAGSPKNFSSISFQLHHQGVKLGGKRSLAIKMKGQSSEISPQHLFAFSVVVFFFAAKL